jgi:hypothetical protein
MKYRQVRFFKKIKNKLTCGIYLTFGQLVFGYSCIPDHTFNIKAIKNKLYISSGVYME